MKIRLLTSMAGDDFAIQYGEIIDRPQAVCDAWVDAGIAEIPKTEAVLEADLATATQEAEAATRTAQAAVEENTQLAVENDQLQAQVEAITAAAGDGADSLKKVGELAAELDTVKKQLSEREAQLGGGVFAQTVDEAETMRQALAGSRAALEAAIGL